MAIPPIQDTIFAGAVFVTLYLKLAKMGFASSAWKPGKRVR
jgi:hypothetical protein